MNKLSHFEILIFYRNKIFREESFFADHVAWRKKLLVYFDDYRYKLNKDDVYDIYLEDLKNARNSSYSNIDHKIKENIEKGIWKDVKLFNNLTNKPISYNAFSGVDKGIIEGVCTYLYDINVIKDNPHFGIHHKIAYNTFLELGLITEKTRKNKLKEENQKLKKELEELKEKLKNTIGDK